MKSFQRPALALLVFLLMIGLFIGQGVGVQAQQIAPEDRALRSGETTLEGTLTLLWVDGFADNVHYALPRLVSADGQMIVLDLEEAVAALFEGETVTVTGDFREFGDADHDPGYPNVGRYFAVENLQTDPNAALSPFTPISGTQRYQNILCRYNGDDVSDLASPNDFQRIFDKATVGLNAYFQQMSYGAFNIDGSQTLAQWVQMPFTRQQYLDEYQIGTDNQGNPIYDLSALWGALAQDCVTAADAQVNFAAFDGINLLLSDNMDRAYALGGGQTLTTSDTGQRFFRFTWNPPFAHNSEVVGHEMGHTIGLRHVGSPDEPYTFRSSIMSGGARCPESRSPADNCYPTGLTGWAAWQLGWMDNNRVTEVGVGNTATFDLQRLRDPGPDGQLFALIDLPGSLNYYAVEARQSGVGADAYIPNSGVILYRVLLDAEDSFLDNTDPPLIVVDGANDGNPNNADDILTVGESFEDPGFGIRVTVNSAAPDGSRYNVTVQNNNDGGPIQTGQYEQDSGVFTGRYTGNWQTVNDSSASGDSYITSSSPGDRLTFDAQGDQLSLLTIKGPTQGTVCIRLDGGACTTFDLNAPGVQYQQLLDALALGGATRTVTVEVVSGNVAIDAVLIGTAPDAPTFTDLRADPSRLAYGVLAQWTNVPNATEYVITLDGEVVATPDGDSNFAFFVAPECETTYTVGIRVVTAFGTSDTTTQPYTTGACPPPLSAGGYDPLVQRNLNPPTVETFTGWGRWTANSFEGGEAFGTVVPNTVGAKWRAIGQTLALDLVEFSDAMTLRVCVADDCTDFAPSGGFGQRTVSVPLPGTEVTITIASVGSGVGSESAFLDDFTISNTVQPPASAPAVTGSSPVSVDLSWGATPNGSATYNLYRDEVRVATGLTTTSTTDEGVKCGRTVNYGVSAVVNGTESPIVTRENVQTGPCPAIIGPGTYEVDAAALFFTSDFIEISDQGGFTFNGGKAIFTGDTDGLATLSADGDVLVLRMARNSFTGSAEICISDACQTIDTRTTEGQTIEEYTFPLNGVANPGQNVTIDPQLEAGRQLVIDEIRIALVEAAPVENLLALPLSETEIDLSWTLPTDEARTGINIYAGDSVDEATLLASLAASATDYQVTGLLCETEYPFTVATVSVNGPGAGVTGSATTLDCPPATATATSTSTPTASASPTASATASSTATTGPTATATASASATQTATDGPSPTASATHTATAGPSPTATSTPTTAPDVENDLNVDGVFGITDVIYLRNRIGQDAVGSLAEYDSNDNATIDADDVIALLAALQAE